MTQRIFEGPAEWQLVAGAILVTLVLAWAGARLVRRLAVRGIRALLSDTVATTSPAVRSPLRLVFIAAFALLVALLLFPAFEIAGLRPRMGIHLRQLVTWTFASGLRIVLIAVIAYALVRMGTLLVKRFEHELNTGTTLDALERAKRARTLGSVITKVFTVVIIAIALLMILRELHVDIAPALAGAGIVGLAVGFGAQTIVRDVISGFFLILEDQVRVGDVVAINNVGGLVEELNLRTIVLRDAEGTVHVFPNGAITTLANKSKDFSYYVIDLSVSYRNDPDEIAALLRQIGAELQQDPTFAPHILEPMEVMGVDAFGDWSMVMKARIKTVPLKQWDVGRELRRRIRKEFEQRGIEPPFPALASTLVQVQRPASDPGTPARS